MKRTLYFAYGSNLHMPGMQFRCPNAVTIGPAILPDWRLTFRGVADVEYEPGATVYGGLWACGPAHMRALDRYEGAPTLYARQRVDVIDGRTEEVVPAIVYVMNDQSSVMLPHHGYYDTIADGYRTWGLPIPELEDSVQRVERVLHAAGYRNFVPKGRKRMQGLRDIDLDWGGMSPATQAELTLALSEEGLL